MSFTIFDSVPFVPVDYLSGNRNFFIRHVVAGKSFMAIRDCGMAAFGWCLRGSVLAVPLAMAMAFWRSGRRGFFLMGRNIGTSSERNSAI